MFVTKNKVEDNKVQIDTITKYITFLWTLYNDEYKSQNVVYTHNTLAAHLSCIKELATLNRPRSYLKVAPSLSMLVCIIIQIIEYTHTHIYICMLPPYVGDPYKYI